jgi:hypothetical protein
MPMMGGLGYREKGGRPLIELPTQEDALAFETRVRNWAYPPAGAAEACPSVPSMSKMQVPS